MDVAAVMALIVKGLGVVETLVEAGAAAGPAIRVLVGVASGAQNGTVTVDELTAAEALLDKQIDDFNAPMD